MPYTKVKGQSWGFTSRSTARVILGQVLRIATCGTRTHRGLTLRKQQYVTFSEMLQNVEGQLIWVDSDPIWRLWPERLMNVTEPELYLGSNMWGELLKF